MKITQAQRDTIERRMKIEAQMAHIHEDREGYEIRKGRERCKAYNREYGTSVAYTMARTKKVRHYSQPKPKGWQKHDQHTHTYTRTEAAVLYSDGVAIVRRVEITTHRTYATDTEEPDKIIVRREAKLPHGTKASVAKLTDFTDLPDTITVEGTEYKRDLLMEALLHTAASIYEVCDRAETVYI